MFVYKSANFNLQYYSNVVPTDFYVYFTVLVERLFFLEKFGM